jgi:hypothetical protein
VPNENLISNPIMLSPQNHIRPEIRFDQRLEFSENGERTRKHTVIIPKVLNSLKLIQNANRFLLRDVHFLSAERRIVETYLCTVRGRLSNTEFNQRPCKTRLFAIQKPILRRHDFATLKLAHAATNSSPHIAGGKSIARLKTIKCFANAACN